MKVIIRRMTVADVPPAHEIDTLSFTLPWPERSLRYEVTNNPAARCWAAEEPPQRIPKSPFESSGRLVGMLVLWLIVDEAHIATVATHPGFRRRGIAKQLLVEALNSAYNEGAQTAMLEVRAGNQAAVRMYEAFGFEVVGRREGYYKDNREDAILMTLARLPITPPG